MGISARVGAIWPIREKRAMLLYRGNGEGHRTLSRTWLISKNLSGRVSCGRLDCSSPGDLTSEPVEISIAGYIAGKRGLRLVRATALCTKSGKKVDVTPIRFAAGCEKGHLQDIDWGPVIHESFPGTAAMGAFLPVAFARNERLLRAGERPPNC